MFSLSKKGKQLAHSHSILNVGTFIEGDFSTEGDLRIDGRLNGNLICKGRLVIGEHAIITGDIVCDNIDVSGSILGNIKAKDTLHLRQTATLQGDVMSAKFVVEPQAKFVGNCRMLPKGEFSFDLLGNTNTVITETPQIHTSSAKPSAPPRKWW